MSMWIEACRGAGTRCFSPQNAAVAATPQRCMCRLPGPIPCCTVFDPRTEQVFKYLQVFSACAVSFAHGSNDVANAIGASERHVLAAGRGCTRAAVACWGLASQVCACGQAESHHADALAVPLLSSDCCCCTVAGFAGPFAGIWYVYNNRKTSSSAETPQWILALGGVGIVIGLATYGEQMPLVALQHMQTRPRTVALCVCHLEWSASAVTGTGWRLPFPAAVVARAHGAVMTVAAATDVRWERAHAGWMHACG
jgi:phosphate/sulfate permease